MDTGEQEAELAKGKAKLAENREAATEVTTEITRRESELKLAEQEFNRSRSLLSRKVIPREEYDQYQTKWETAQATLNGAKPKSRASPGFPARSAAPGSTPSSRPPGSIPSRTGRRGRPPAACAPEAGRLP